MCNTVFSPIPRDHRYSFTLSGKWSSDNEADEVSGLCRKRVVDTFVHPCMKTKQVIAATIEGMLR